MAFGHQTNPAAGATTSASLDISLEHCVGGRLVLPANIVPWHDEHRRGVRSTVGVPEVALVPSRAHRGSGDARARDAW